MPEGRELRDSFKEENISLSAQTIALKRWSLKKNSDFLNFILGIYCTDKYMIFFIFIIIYFLKYFIP